MAKRMTKSKSAASRYGVYVGTGSSRSLAYVSTKKLDANKAASKLKLSGRVGISIKAVGANPVSGKVPKIGWRSQYAKAAYAAVKAPKSRRKAARTVGRIRRAVGRSGNPKPGYKYAIKSSANVAWQYFKTLAAARKYAKKIANTLQEQVDIYFVSSKGVPMLAERADHAFPDHRRNPSYSTVGAPPARRRANGKGVGRSRNAASILLRRANPSGVIQRSHVGKSFSSLPGARGSDASSFGRVLAIDVGKRYYIRGGIFQIESNSQRDARLKRNPRRNPSAKRTTKSKTASRDRYLVQVGDTPAWVGRLKSDANKAFKKLEAAGHKGLKIFKAQVTKVVTDGWKPGFRRAALGWTDANVSKRANPGKRNPKGRNPPGAKYLIKRFRKIAPEKFTKTLRSAELYMNKNAFLGMFDVYKIGAGPIPGLDATSLYGVYDPREKVWVEKA